MISHGQTSIMVDCGLSRKRTVERMKDRGIDPASISAIFVTHEHKDHIAGINVFVKKFGTPVMATRALADELKVSDQLINEISAGGTDRISDITVRSVSVPHDAADPVQFVMEGGNLKFGILTDIGHVTEEVVEHYEQCDALFVEANHDREMLWNGEYPDFLKQRVGGDFGHLSNEQTLEFIDSVLHEGLKTVVIGHISKKNNAMDLLHEQFDRFSDSLELRFASQESGTEWIDVA